MSLYQLEIEPKENNKRSEAARKGRRFTVTCLGGLLADGYWDSGAGAGTLRPPWLVLGGTDRALRPVVANLQTGQRAVLTQPETYGQPSRLELLKSAGYKYLWQRCTDTPAGPLATVTAFLPDLFRLNPGGIDPAGVRFLALTPTWWSRREAGRLSTAERQAITAHLRAYAQLQTAPWTGWPPEQWLALVPQAVHAMSFVERRTTRPLIQQPAFYLQLFLAGLAAHLWLIPAPQAPGQTRAEAPPDDWDWARPKERVPVISWGTEALGLCPPVACQTTHEVLDAFLARQVQHYFAAQARAG